MTTLANNSEIAIANDFSNFVKAMYGRSFAFG